MKRAKIIAAVAMCAALMSRADCPKVVIITPPPYNIADSMKAIAVVGGGVRPYIYRWGNGCTDSVCAVMDSGSYVLWCIVQDAAGCGSGDTLIVKR